MKNSQIKLANILGKRKAVFFWFFFFTAHKMGQWHPWKWMGKKVGKCGRSKLQTWGRGQIERRAKAKETPCARMFQEVYHLNLFGGKTVAWLSHMGSDWHEWMNEESLPQLDRERDRDREMWLSWMWLSTVVLVCYDTCLVHLLIYFECCLNHGWSAHIFCLLMTSEIYCLIISDKIMLELKYHVVPARKKGTKRKEKKNTKEKERSSEMLLTVWIISMKTTTKRS